MSVITTSLSSITSLRARNENDVVTSVPSKRRSLVNQKKIIPVEDNGRDDEQERSRRRSIIDIEGKLSNIAQSPLRDNVSGTDIAVHFESCTKLLTQNKINSKNVWSLKTIDYMRSILQKFKNPLQIGTTGLDVATKVYSVRVEDAHSHCFKLASSITENKSKDSDETVENDENGENLRPKEKKRRRFSESKKLTVVDDVNSLLADVVKIDKLLFQMRPDPELSIIENLCTNRIPMNFTGNKFMLMSQETFWPTDDLRAATTNQADEKFYLEIDDVLNYRLCGPFAGFAADEWDPEQMDKTNMEQTGYLNDVLIFDETGLPLAQLDSSIHVENFENDNNDGIDNDVNMDNHEVDGPIFHNELEMVTEFGPDNRTVTTEYTYRSIPNIENGKIIENIWAGPSHWKLKCIKQNESKYLGKKCNKESVKKTRKKSEIKLESIKFMNFTELIDVSNVLKIKRKPSTVDKSNLIFPMHTMSAEEMLKDFSVISIKPSTFVTKKSITKEDVDCEENPYNYNNPNDSLYCSQQSIQNDMIENDEEQEDDVFREEHTVGHVNDFVNDLAEAPNLASKIVVPYALQAKKMDMKKLKKAVWNCLTNGQSSDNQPQELQVKVAPIKFLQVYEKLPSLLNNNMKEELSCHLAFVALLHLANEHNLVLRDQSDLKDLIIST